LAIPNEFCRKAKAKALEALQRDSEAAEPHTILADEVCLCAWNWVAAEQEVRRAIEINPNLGRAHSSHGRYLLTMDRTDEALA
jgi:Tfp pilus assembly protein PilF